MRDLLTLLSLLLAPNSFAGKASGGCDTLSVPFRGKDKKFTAEMKQVEKRIAQICDGQVPSLDNKLTGLTKQCAGTFTSGSDVRVDLMDENFRARTRALCSTLKEAKDKVQGGKDSFCSRLAERSSRTTKLFTDADGTNPPGNQNEIIGRLTRQRDDYNTTAKSFLGAAHDASFTQTFIDRSLPASSDPNSTRTEDASLKKLSASIIAAAGKQMEQIRASADKLRAANPRPADAAQIMSKLNESNQACGQLKGFMRGYVDAMENNLLPNGRMMSKLLSSAQESAKKEAAAYTDSSSKITGTLQRLTIADLSQDPAIAKAGASTISGPIQPGSAEAAQMTHWGPGGPPNVSSGAAVVDAQPTLPVTPAAQPALPNGSAAVADILSTSNAAAVSPAGTKSQDSPATTLAQTVSTAPAVPAAPATLIPFSPTDPNKQVGDTLAYAQSLSGNAPAPVVEAKPQVAPVTNPAISPPLSTSAGAAYYAQSASSTALQPIDPTLAARNPINLGAAAPAEMATTGAAQQVDANLAARAPASPGTVDTGSVAPSLVPAYQRTGSSNDDYNETAYNAYEAAKPTYDSQIDSGQKWLSKQTGFFSGSYPGRNSGWVQDGSDPIILRDNPGGVNATPATRYFRYKNLNGDVMLLPGQY